MIEILLQAERTLAAGRLDEAERLYRQASDADPRNSIAVVGLARVALERDDEPGAYRLARRALEIDPENVAAQRLTQRLEEIYAYRGESIAALAGFGVDAGQGADADPGGDASLGGGAGIAEAHDAPEPAAPSGPGDANLLSADPSSPTLNSTPPPQPSLLDRLLRRSHS